MMLQSHAPPFAVRFDLTTGVESDAYVGTKCTYRKGATLDSTLLSPVNIIVFGMSNVDVSPSMFADDV